MQNKIKKNYWLKFKQELVPIVFLSTLHVWWCFNFPAFIRLGNPWGTLLSVIMTIVGVFLCIYILTFTDICRPILSLDYLDKDPDGPALKIITRISSIIIAHLGIFFVWYNNLYGMSNIHYAFAYFNFLMIAVLQNRAANRWPDPEED